MSELEKRIEELRELLKRHRKSDFKEYPTRTIFIDPLLGALGWDVRDPDEVELEWPTIDAKSVDYALKINGKPVAFVEAKPLGDALGDVKAITQVVGYAANDGVSWCILTNGIRYRVYSSAEKATAPNKLLFEVSLDPDAANGSSVEQISLYLKRLSRASMAEGVLDELGEEVFTTAKVRKALERLFTRRDAAFVRLVRKELPEDKIAPAQIRDAMSRIWGTSDKTPTPPTRSVAKVRRLPSRKAPRNSIDYGEQHHTDGKPAEIVEIYRALDRMCQEFAVGGITRRFLAQNIAWSYEGKTFCSAHLQRNGLRVWLRLDPAEVASLSFARNVSKIGHWGVGDVELALESSERLHEAESLIRQSFNSITGENE